jgi:RNA polymerase sigma factor (sigma-70 family)
VSSAIAHRQVFNFGMNYELPTPAEQSCFLQYKKGEEEGFTQLYRMMFNPLLRYGMRILPNEFAVATIVQEAFLKAWNFRERMTCLQHTFRFMCMNVKWACYDHYRQPGNRQVIYLEHDTYSDVSFFPGLEEAEPICNDEELLKSIYDVMPYLSMNKQTILQLYFKYGFSYKQIARRYGSNVQAISNDLHEALAYLKKVIHSKKQLTQSVSKPVTNAKYRAEEYLTGEMLQLFKLRYENKLPFDVIAAKMNLPQPYVQQQYVAAHAKLQQLKTKCH